MSTKGMDEQKIRLKHDHNMIRNFLKSKERIVSTNAGPNFTRVQHNKYESVRICRTP
ncbi:hypothetical protein [Leptospira borgpetersenii]|uniref:hypothetical protein n=1 Tax=Leptospira borgpetersenii TaxID=174 RepID=UPI00190FDA27|nr:hypothetical protein [Leptospira borgpetersenii]